MLGIRTYSYVRLRFLTSSFLATHPDKRLFRSALSLFVFLFFSTAALAQDLPHNPQPFAAWLADFKNEAKTKGFEQSFLDKTFQNVAPKQRIIELDRNQPEGKLTLNQYQARTVTPQRIKTAQKLLQENKALLQKISQKYGVQPAYIIALWGMETDFGRITGGFSLVEALATLAYDGRRSAYFRKELFNALQILKEGHITPEKFTGSWAGAMGQCQFMPSSFLKFAVDETGDGHKDIWQTRADVFASIANYLRQNGWNGAEEWGMEIVMPSFNNSQQRDAFYAMHKQEKPLTAWRAMHLKTLDGKPLPALATSTTLIIPEQNGSRAFLVYKNHSVLLNWNRSNLFALSVSKLADAMREQPQ
jgi:membrane-bound lytic murein transglycosylase B